MNMLRNSSVWAGVIAGGLSQWKDTQAYRHGEIRKADYKVHTVGNITGAAGLAAGIEYGALLGTMVVPGIGTVVGSILGGLAGDKFGRFLGEGAASAVFKPGARAWQDRFEMDHM
jgi:outer membrane lipoprotein SlyB